MLAEINPQLVQYGAHSRSGAGVLAQLSYVVPEARRPFLYAYEPPAGLPWEGASFVDVLVRIDDARRAQAGPRLHVNGFELADAPTKMRDFHDYDEVKRVYYDEVLEIALAATGGSYGFVFDHIVRKRDPSQHSSGFGRKVLSATPSVNGRIHNDYTERSGQRRLRLVLGEGEPADSIYHYCIVNVWRSITNPVLDAPLALCDSRTVSISDAVAAEVRYAGRLGEIYLFRSSPWHRWYYYPCMQRSEAVVFKQYDSRLSGVSRFTPHSAFEHPATPVGAPPRESIEARVLVAFE